jgi:hypothetical protein
MPCDSSVSLAGPSPMREDLWADLSLAHSCSLSVWHTVGTYYILIERTIQRKKSMEKRCLLSRPAQMSRVWIRSFSQSSQVRLKFSEDLGITNAALPGCFLHSSHLAFTQFPPRALKTLALNQPWLTDMKSKALENLNEGIWHASHFSVCILFNPYDSLTQVRICFVDEKLKLRCPKVTGWQVSVSLALYTLRHCTAVCSHV